MSPATRAREALAPIAVDGLDLDAFRDRPVAVLGFARSGIALARFLADHGAHVTVYDARPADALGGAIDALAGRPVRLLLGPDVDPADALAGQALVATSPSVNARYPTTEPRLREALTTLEADGIVPVVSEVDLFLRLCPATTVGVTGTKGKTTTSSLVAAVLGAGDAPVVLGGNIGTPLVERLPELSPRHRVVLELSELQLPTLSRGTDVAVYTHVTSDHLDRHGSLDAYRAAKRRLAELLRPGGVLVVNGEDPVTSGYVTPPGVRRVTYRRAQPASDEFGVADGWIVDPTGERILPLADIPLPGWHNVSNVLAAVAVGRILGVAAEGIRTAVSAFAGVEHRLEHVATIDGVRFINDSQGTQPDAVIAALRSFEAPLVLIAGGRDKGVPLDELASVAAERAAAVVLIGESAPALEGLLRGAGLTTVEREATLESAVRRAGALARAALGDGRAATTATVLLSPAAASFDMFEDYAARGRAFREAVATLAAEGEDAR